MRLFIAIQPPPEIRSLLTRFAQELPGIRPGPENQLHLTLAFLGEVNPRDIEEIEARLTEVRAEPFELCTGGLGTFSSGVIWVGVEENPALTEMHRSVRRALRASRELRLQTDGRPFVPHITLGRLTRPAQTGGPLHLPQPERCCWTVDRFGLYSSQLHPDGARHRLECEFIAERRARPARPRPAN